MSPPLDRTSLKLMDLLQQDARMTVSDIARKMNRADSTVRERIISLERQGVLRGYRALIDPAVIGYRTHAILRAECDYPILPALAKQLAAIPNVTSAQLTTGPKPLCIRVTTEDMPTLERVLQNRIAPLPIDRLEAKVVVSSLVDERPLQLLALQTNGLHDQFAANFTPKRADAPAEMPLLTPRL